MFTRLAKSGLARFWPVQPQPVAPGLRRATPPNTTCSNGNLPGFRRPAGSMHPGILRRTALSDNRRCDRATLRRPYEQEPDRDDGRVSACVTVLGESSSSPAYRPWCWWRCSSAPRFLPRFIRALLFCIGVLVAFIRGRGESKRTRHRRVTIEKPQPGCWR